MIVRRIGIASLAKISAVIYGALGFLAGLLVTLASVFGAAFGEPRPTGVAETVIGLGGVIVLPLLYSLFGFVIGGIAAAVYNVAVGFVGGLELEVDVGPTPVTATPPERPPVA